MNKYQIKADPGHLLALAVNGNLTEDHTKKVLEDVRKLITEKPSLDLKIIFNKIDNTPDPVKVADSIETIRNILNNSEAHVRNLKELKDSLELTDTVHKGDVINVVRCLRKIYSLLGVWEEVSQCWIDLRGKLNVGSSVFNGLELSKTFLLNKQIMILDRTIFTLKKKLENVKPKKVK